MEIVCFEQKYEEELIELWNQTMIFDPVSADKFRTQVLLDENFDRELCLLARTKDRVVGFILGIKRRFPYLERGLEPDRGWISLMFVAKEFRRRGIGTSLVCEIEKRLLYLGTETITLAAYSPNYFFRELISRDIRKRRHFSRQGDIRGQKNPTPCARISMDLS